MQKIDNLIVGSSITVPSRSIDKDGVDYDKLPNTIYVSSDSDYTTLKDAVDYFNAHAASDMTIGMDAGEHLIEDTIVVDSSYRLCIRGMGAFNTTLIPTVAMQGKPLFTIKSESYFNMLSIDATGVGTYGTDSNDVGFLFDAAASGKYCEFTDFTLCGCYDGIKDAAGVDVFIFNFIICDCHRGYVNDHASSGNTDMEVGNFENCDICVDLVNGVGDHYIARDILFIMVAGEIGIKYDGLNYDYGNLMEIVTCTKYGEGTLFSGFDFTLERDANIVIKSCVSEEYENNDIKFYGSMSDGSSTTSSGSDTAKWKKMNYIFDNNTPQKISFVYNPLIPVTSITSNGTIATVVTTSPHGLIDNDIVRLFNWKASAGDVDIFNDYFTITKINDTQFSFPTTAANGVTGSEGRLVKDDTNILTYLSDYSASVEVAFFGNLSADNNNRTIIIGVAKNGDFTNIEGKIYVRTTTSGVPYIFYSSLILSNLQKDDTFELVARCLSANTVITTTEIGLKVVKI